MNKAKKESEKIDIIVVLPIVLFFGALLCLGIGSFVYTNNKKVNMVEKKNPQSFIGYKLEDVCDYYTSIEECKLNGYCDEEDYSYTVIPSIRFDDGVNTSKITCNEYKTSIMPHETLYISEFFYEQEDTYDRFGQKDGYQSSKYFRASPLEEAQKRGVTIHE